MSSKMNAMSQGGSRTRREAQRMNGALTVFTTHDISIPAWKTLVSQACLW
jgi:hypothetical protein